MWLNTVTADNIMDLRRQVFIHTIQVPHHPPKPGLVMEIRVTETAPVMKTTMVMEVVVRTILEEVEQHVVEESKQEMTIA